MNETILYKYLEELRGKYLEDRGLYSLPIDDVVTIEDKTYERIIWSEEYQGNELIIFQLEIKAFIGSNNYCLGIEAGNNGINKLLTNENLWDIGIP